MKREFFSYPREYRSGGTSRWPSPFRDLLELLGTYAPDDGDQSRGRSAYRSSVCVCGELTSSRRIHLQTSKPPSSSARPEYRFFCAQVYDALLGLPSLCNCRVLSPYIQRLGENLRPERDADMVKY